MSSIVNIGIYIPYIGSYGSESGSSNRFLLIETLAAILTRWTPTNTWRHGTLILKMASQMGFIFLNSPISGVIVITYTYFTGVLGPILKGIYLHLVDSYGKCM